MLQVPSSFADILSAVEAFEAQEALLITKKIKSPQDSWGDFIDLQTFFINFDIEEASLSARRFNPQELQVLDCIKLGMIYSRVGGKWLYEHIENMKRKVQKWGSLLSQKMQKAFMFGIANRMMEGDTYSVLTLADWINFDESKLKMSAEYAVIRLLESIFEYDEAIKEINLPSGLKAAHEKCQAAFDMIQNISLRYHLTREDLQRCHLSAQALIKWKGTKSA